MYSIPATTFVALFTAIGLRRWQVAWSAVCLLSNWIVNATIYKMTDDAFNWQSMAMVDYATAIALFPLVASKGKALLIASYAIELMAHGAFYYSQQGGWEKYYYYYTLVTVAWGQIAVLLGWTCHGGLKRILLRVRNGGICTPVGTVLMRVGARSAEIGRVT